MGLWAISLGLVFLMPAALPAGKGGAFFSFAGLEPERSIDWLDLYIPANPFRSLANNVVPAVVVFAVLAGVGLMTLPRKQTLLEPLAVFNDAMGRVGSLLARLTPLGIFAIAGNTAGTMHLEEFERLQGFVLTYAVFACLLTFWLLPGLVAALTTVSHRRIIALAQDALVTAFVTSNLFVVLPILVERSRTLLAERRAAATGPDDGERENELVDVLVPTSFNFPHGAKVLSIGFVLFAGWYAGIDIPGGRYPALAGAGLLAVFGSINTAIPFLLDLARVPADLFQLFVVSGVLNSRFGAMTSAMHTVVVAVLGTALVTGRIELRRKAIVRYLVTSALMVAAAVGGTRAVLARVLPDPAKGERDPGRAGAASAPGPGDPPAHAAARARAPALAPGSRLAAILTRGELRVGFDDDAVPWAYVNGKGEVVGFDAEMAHSLAIQLGVRLQFVLLPREQWIAALDRGVIDIVMSGTRASARLAAQVTFSQPYAEESLAFLVEDYRRDEFASVDKLRGRRLRIGVAPGPGVARGHRPHAPRGGCRPGHLVREFVEKRPRSTRCSRRGSGRARGACSARSWDRWPWSRGRATTVLAYALPRDEPELRRVVDTWIDIARATSGSPRPADTGSSARPRGRRGSAGRSAGTSWACGRSEARDGRETAARRPRPAPGR